MNINRKSTLQFVFILVIIIIINFISSRAFFRIDLTSDNRYTLKETTKEILKDLDDVVYFKIYLEGDLPIGLKRMQKRIKETLDEFRVYAGDNIQYRFINPSEANDQSERRAMYKDLREKGLRATNVKQRDKEGGYAQKIIFPGAIVNHGEKQTVVNMLKNNPGLSAEKNLNHSIQALEFELVDAVYKLTIEDKQPIAFVTGHGELDKYEVGDLTNELMDYYQVDRVKPTNVSDQIMDYKTLIVAKPRKSFSKSDKYVLDQYLMRGGKILWLYEPVKINMDSLSRGATTVARVDQLNLHDQLFKYGVRVNPNLVKDLQSAVIPVNTAYSGDKPKFSPTPWLYFPLLSSMNNHPINKNLKLIRSEFASTIDTLPAFPGMKKTVLLQTTKNTQVVQAPVIVSLREVEQKVNPRQFNMGRQIIGVLLDGKFQSVFKNRFVKDMEDSTRLEYRENSKSTQQIVISDGDLVKNEVNHRPNGVYISRLGYDKYTQQTFGNKNFAINVVHYLADKKGLINIRGKEVKLRLLDKSKISQEHFKWQIINVVLPILVIIFFGIIKNIIRRRKYTV